MDVRCERCRAQYVFDDDQVTPTGLTVQCTNCGHLFMVKKKELVVTVPVKPGDLAATPVPASAAGLRVPTPPGGTAAAGLRRPSSPGMSAVGSEAPPREWRLRHPGGNTFAFRELTTLQKWIIEQKVGRDDEISLSGEQWKRLGDIAELGSFFEVVEAAERSRAQAAMPPAHLTPMPMTQATGAVPLFPPPPPSGFPPPSFVAPRVQAAAPALVAAPPVHEVEVSFDDEPPPRRKASQRPVLLIGVALVILGAGAAAVLAPRLLGPARAPAPVVLEAPRAPPPPVAQPAPEAEAEAEAPPPAPQPAAPEVAPPVPAPAAKGAAAAPKAPQTPRALLARAKGLQQRGDAAGALELFGRLASDDPGNVEAQAGRGLCYLDLESWAPAEASFQAALRVEPDHADALLGLAETYRFQGKKAQAIPMYERYLARYPDGEEAQVAKNALAELRE